MQFDSLLLRADLINTKILVEVLVDSSRRMLF